MVTTGESLADLVLGKCEPCSKQILKSSLALALSLSLSLSLSLALSLTHKHTLLPNSMNPRHHGAEGQSAQPPAAVSGGWWLGGEGVGGGRPHQGTGQAV